MNKQTNIYKSERALPTKTVLWSICCLPWEQKQDNSIYELFSQKQLPLLTVTKKIMWLYMLCNANTGQSICIHAKISLFQGSARPTSLTGYAVQAESIWLYRK